MKPTVLPRRLGTHGPDGRELFLFHVEQASALTAISIPRTRYFATLIAWDSQAASTEELFQVARVLLDAGCVYFCCWGPGCERLHDAIDEEYSVDGVTVDHDESTIMTTWHSDETAEEAAWFLLHSAFPDDRFFNECRAAVAVCIGGKVLSEQMRAAILAAAKNAA